MSEEENKQNLTNQALIAKNQNLQEQIIRLQAKLELMRDLYQSLLDRRF